MATNAVSICSNALLMLGADPINSFDEGTAGARLASNLYALVRDRILRSHPWNCAVKRVILAPDATPPVFDYSAQFTLPSDWLKTLQVGSNCENLTWVTESRKILCDVDALRLRYIFRNTVEGTWDSLLIDAMTAAMTVVFAYPITESTSLRDSFREEFMQKMREARTVDGQDDPPEEFGDFPLLAARYGG